MLPRRQGAESANEGRPRPRAEIRHGANINRHNAAHQPRLDGGNVAAGNSARMPSQAVLEHAFSMLTGVDRHTIDGMTAGNTHAVTNHLYAIIAAAARPSQLDPRVRDAAQQANGSGEQLIRNLLALVTASSPVLPSNHVGNPSSLPSQEVLTDAVGMLTGLHDTDLTAVTGLNTHNVVNHLHDIATLRPDELPSPVRRAARAANNYPEQLVRNLLVLVTADPPVLSNRRRTEAQPANQPVSRMPRQEVLRNALDMLTGLHDTDLTSVTGRNTLNVINHLHDIATMRTDELRPLVRRAARGANNDPEQLVRNLLALVTANPPLLSNRRGSSVQPASPPDEGGRMAGAPIANGANNAPQANRPAQLTRSNALNREHHLTVANEVLGAATPSRPGAASGGR